MRLPCKYALACTADHNRTMKTLSERLTEARTDAGLSQGALAKLAGCGQSTIASIERGCNQGSTILPRVAEILGVSAIWLAEGRGSKKTTSLPGLLPSVNLEGMTKLVESGNASTPARPSISDIDRVVSAALALIGITLDDYLSARRSGNEVGLQSSRGHASKTIGEQDAKVPSWTAGKVMKG